MSDPIPLRWLAVSLFTVCLGLTACADDELTAPPEQINNPILRAQFETKLFNHLLVRGELPMSRHQLAVHEMADHGFYPATLALRLYALGRSDLKTGGRSAENALAALAERGDATAQCLYVFYWGQDVPSDLWRRYVTQAADAGVARCMVLRSDHIEKDKAQRLYWAYQGAVKGDLYGQIGMAFVFSEGELVPKDLKRAVCWAMKAKEFDSDFGRGNYQDTLYFYKRSHLDMRLPPPDAAFCQNVIETQS